MDFSKLVVPEDLSFGVDDSITLDERELQIPLNLSEVGVTNDNKVERLNFKVPAVFDGVNDLSTFTWWVNYRNALGYDNLYHVDDLKKEGDYLTFSWLTDENLYAESGDAHFSLRAVHEDGRAFGTKVATLRVAKGLNTASTIYEHDYDFINQYFAELDGIKKEVQTGVSQIESVKADAESARQSAVEAKKNADELKNKNITVDAEMSDTSTNPVQNKIAKAYIDVNNEKFNEQIYTTGATLTLPLNTYSGYAKIENIKSKVYTGTYNIFQLLGIEDSEFDVNGVHISIKGTKISITGISTAPAYISLNKGRRIQKDELSESQNYELPQGSYYMKLFPAKWGKGADNVSVFIVDSSSINNDIGFVNGSARETPLMQFSENWGQFYMYIGGDIQYDCEGNLGLFNSYFDSSYRVEKNSVIKAISQDGIYELGDLTFGDAQAILKKTELKTDNLQAQINNIVNPQSIVWLGDSISMLQKLPHRVGELLNSTIYDGSIAGSTMSVDDERVVDRFISVLGFSKSITSGDFTNAENAVKELGGGNVQPKLENIQHLKEADYSKVDKIVIFAGTNDLNNDYVTASKDLKGFKERMKQAVTNIITKYPNIQIYGITPMFRNDIDVDKHGNTLLDFVNAEIEVYKSMNFPVFDFYHDCGINELNASYYLADGLHQNEKGDSMLAEKIANFLKAN